MGALKGKVYLVGAGPGAADLITVRGLRAIRAAQALICDDLLPRTFLEDLGVASADKEVHWVRDANGHRTQDEINRMMEQAALAGRTVARVKNGDPFVFGRGAEEVEALAGSGIACEVIPGLSSCLAAPAAAGLPLTRRGEERSFEVTTARLAGGELNTVFPRADSLVILMGASALEEVVRRLLASGWLPEIPAAIVERAALPWERRVEGRLSEIVAKARELGVQSPTVLVVGGAALRRGAFRSRPRILFTGLDPSRFRTLGDLVHWPALCVVEDDAGRKLLPEAIDGLRFGRYAWVVFTSPVGARSFFAALRGHGADGRLLAGSKVMVAGAGTAGQVEEFGILADAVPAEAGSPGILKGLGAGGGERMLVVQGSHAPRGLISELERVGWRPTLLSLHRVQPHPELGRPLPGHDVVYFVSPSGVRAFAGAYGEAALRKGAWCIGEATRQALAAFGCQAKVVSPHEHS